MPSRFIFPCGFVLLGLREAFVGAEDPAFGLGGAGAVDVGGGEGRWGGGCWGWGEGGEGVGGWWGGVECDSAEEREGVREVGEELWGKGAERVGVWVSWWEVWHRWGWKGIWNADGETKAVP